MRGDVTAITVSFGPLIRTCERVVHDGVLRCVPPLEQHVNAPERLLQVLQFLLVSLPLLQDLGFCISDVLVAQLQLVDELVDVACAFVVEPLANVVDEAWVQAQLLLSLCHAEIKGPGPLARTGAAVDFTKLH